MKTTLRRLTDLYEITSAEARYIVKVICKEYGMFPTDGEIDLDSAYTQDYPDDMHASTTRWVHVTISAQVRGVWYRFGIDLAQSRHSNNTMCANMTMKEA